MFFDFNLLKSVTKQISPAGSKFNILEASILNIQKAFSIGQITSEKLTNFYLERITKYDKQGPELNAVITINPRAIDEAKALDEERRIKGPRSKLMGIPIVLKDNIDTFDMPTSGGCKAMQSSQSKKDAFLTIKLREAGAIIIAKTNLHELAKAGLTVSSLGGQTLNPYDLTRTPGGSSGGTAVAIAANFAVAGIGTDTVNSVRSPASANNLVGFRPTYGLVSRSGIIPAALTQDMAGTITRSVEDAAIMLNVLAGTDISDSETNDAAYHIQNDYTQFLDKNGLDGKRIGILKAIIGHDFQVEKVFSKALRILKDKGAELVEIDDPAFDTQKIIKECDVQVWESNPQLDDYFVNLGEDAPIHSCKELIATGTVDKSAINILLDSQAHYPNNLREPSYLQALANGKQLRNLIEKTMNENKLDAFAYPHQQLLVSKVIDRDQPGRNGILASIGQAPAITVPGGFSTPDSNAPLGVPVGIEFMGRKWGEPTLISIAYAFEQATHYRQVPKSTP